MSDFIWGLTTQDIRNAFWNGLSQNIILFGGIAAAAGTVMIAHRILSSNNRYGQSSQTTQLFCALAGICGGIAATFHFADRLHHVTFAADKALKFFVLSLVSGAIGLQAGLSGMVIGLITFGGACGYFGRSALLAHGTIGAVIGAVGITWISYLGQS